MIKLNIEPKTVKTWEQFNKQAQNYSIALDGYVSDKTRYNSRNLKLNINHHENVNRLSTKSTSSQIYMLIKQGLMSKFKDNDINIYINHSDEDICLALWLLLNYRRIIKKNEYLIERLVDIEDKLDVTGGTYPFDPGSNAMKEVAWVFEPYAKSRLSGMIDNMNPNEMKLLINKVLARIEHYCNGRSKKINLDTRYKIIYSGKNWVMLEEIGSYSRLRFIRDGIKAFISVKKRKDGKYNYILSKTNSFVEFSLERIYKILNKVENIKNNNKWGGSDIIGGNLRTRGSKINPENLIRIINKVYK